MSRFRLDRFRGWAVALALSIFALPSLAQAQRLNGDVNNDGNVTALDAQAVLSAAVGNTLASGFTASFGDANCDGAVTAVDAQIILMYAVQANVSQFCVGKSSGGGTSIVTVDAGTGNVLVGSTLTLTATPRDSTNAPIDGKTVTWGSSDVTKATVSTAGVVTGVATGTVTITATVDGKAGTATVTVLASSTTRTLSVSPTIATVLVGGTTQVSGSVRDAANNPVTGATITWTSAASTIASVGSSTGLVTGVALGATKITATYTPSGGAAVTQTVDVSVVNPAAKANRTWSAGAGTNDWGTAANWTPAGVPIATDTILVPAAPTIQPTLSANSGVAGLIIEKNAKLTIGGNELQISGRVDVDGEVLGTATGKISVTGTNQATSYVRGALPNVSITGTTVLVGPLTVTGSLELNGLSVLDINAQTVNVSKDLSIKGSLYMRTTLGLIDVRGNARFFNDAQTNATALTAGTLKVGGNLTVVVPPSVTTSPFSASGTHRVILNGAAKQTVSDTGLAVVQMQELDISNTAGGVVFTSEKATQRLKVLGRVTGTTASAISGDWRVNVMSHFTTAGGSVTLRNLAVGGVLTAQGTFKPDTLTLIGAQSIPAGAAYQYQTMVVAGLNRFTGETAIANSLIVGCTNILTDCLSAGSTATLGGKHVTVGGDLRQGALETSAQLIMTAATDSMIVKGGLLGPVGLTTGAVEFTVGSGSWTNGVLRVAGNFSARGNGASGTHVVFLDGAAQQTLRVISGFSFQTLNLSSVGVTMNDTTPVSLGRKRLVNVLGDMNIFTASPLSGTGRMNVAGNVQTATGSSVTLSAISIGSALRAAGAFTPDTAEFASVSTAQTIQNLPAYNTILVSGPASFGGSFTIAGSLIVAGNGSLSMDGRNVTVTKDLSVAGVLKMQDVRDTLTIQGNATFTRANDPSAEAYVTSGVLRVTGNLTGSQPGGFYPSGSHKTILTTSGFGKNAVGYFQDLEVIGIPNSQLTLGTSVVRGSIVASAGLGKIILDSVLVSGNATFTQADTVKTSGKKTIITGNLILTNYSTNTTYVTGNVTVNDKAKFTGIVFYSGSYTELGTIDIPGNARPALLTVAGARFVQQPPATTVVNTPFSPPLAVEIFDSKGVRIKGNAIITLLNFPMTGTLRLITVDGLATFTGVAPSTVTTGGSLNAQYSAGSGLQGSTPSNTFVVTASAPPPPSP